MKKTIQSLEDEIRRLKRNSSEWRRKAQRSISHDEKMDLLGKIADMNNKAMFWELESNMHMDNFKNERELLTKLKTDHQKLSIAHKTLQDDFVKEREERFDATDKLKIVTELYNNLQQQFKLATDMYVKAMELDALNASIKERKNS